MSDKLFYEITVSTRDRNELVDITREVSSFVGASGVKDGICYVSVPHTTAAVTINENADPDVKSDLLMGLSDIVPSDLPYEHSEGNSPAHIKTSMIGSSEEIIINNGHLVLGTWQGLYLCEFDGARTRRVYMKIIEG